MSVALPKAPAVDRETLRDAIREEYQEVAREPNKGFHFHTGRRLAAILDYDPSLFEGVPEKSVESFAGTGNPFSIAALSPGENVVDIGCGAGIDSLIAANMVGPEGKVVGIDMTPAMLEKAEASRQEAGVDNLELKEGYGEALPVPDGWADVIISNGAFNLMPDKLKALDEMNRVLKPGGRLQIADILVQKPVGEKAKEKIDLWTG